MARDEFWHADDTTAEVVAKMQISCLPVDPFAIADREGIVCEEISSCVAGKKISGC